MDIEVNMGEMAVTRRHEDNLMTLGVGSCVVVTLYDPKRKIGGLAHAMLPARLGTVDDQELLSRRPPPAASGKYIEAAIDDMIGKIEVLGGSKEDLEAKLIGGANMFTDFESEIGKDNVACAMKKLKQEGIRLAGEVVGGSKGRSVEFAVASGIVTVKIKF